MKRNVLFNVLCMISFALLLCDDTIPAIALSVSGGIAIAVLLSRHKDSYTFSLQKNNVPTDLVFCLTSVFAFANRWSESSKIKALAARLGMSNTLLLILGAAALCVFSIFVFDGVVTALKKILGYPFRNVKQERKDRMIWGVMTTLVILFAFFAVQYSCLNAVYEPFPTPGTVILANILMAVAAISVLAVFLGRKISFFFFLLILWVWSVANHYTILFHGSPLYISELASAKTAMEVLDGYHIPIDQVAILLTLLSWLLMAQVVTLPVKKQNGSGIKRFLLRTVAACLTVMLAVRAYQSVIKQYEIWAPWERTVARCGYYVCLVKDVERRQNPVILPDGYDVEKIRSAKQTEVEQGTEDPNLRRPDVIFILNETFCDLTFLANLETDVDAFGDYYGIDGAVYGFAVTPNTGGGTNNAEFELLTSKSMHLLAQEAPFTFLGREQLQDRSIVGYLKNLGYVTSGMHCEAAENYKRNVVYPEMGFDHVYLGIHQFTRNRYGNRSWLDKDNYQDMLSFYESNLSEAPQLLYLLTFQNHGGYEQNGEELDTIHVTGDYWDLTDDLNEYLSSVRLSSEAFRWLTEYLSGASRDVIVCMVGDHAPPFISALPVRSDLAIQDASIARRIVPYVIWSNFDADFSFYTDYASMTDLVPMTLCAAGLPLSPFYREVLDLHEKYPVRTREGDGVDTDLTIKRYEEDETYKELLDHYYYMEYNSLLENGEYLEELFIP